LTKIPNKNMNKNKNNKNNNKNIKKSIPWNRNLTSVDLVSPFWLVSTLCLPYYHIVDLMSPF